MSSNQKKKVHFISLGCPKNLVDSEIMAGSLLEDGFSIENNPENADTIIVNTCGFIEDSKKESLSKILESAKLKKTGSLKNLVVAGCLTQRYKDDLVKGLPEADIFIGSGEFQNISTILKNRENGLKKKSFYTLPTFLQEENTPRINSQPGHRAYLKISEGCLKRCSFCAIPKIRGNIQSRSWNSIIKEAETLVKQGVKEFNIISHDFTDYGFDLKRKNPISLESPEFLLDQLSRIQGIHWIRILYLYPDGITPKMIQLIRERPQLVKYFDMPLQHINDSVLSKMNRKMTKEDIKKTLALIRSQIPEAVIRTQFIVGFPGETEKAFEELLEFIEEQQFDRVGCFKFSPEETTPAFKMKSQVSEKIKQSRYERLMALQQEISYKKNRTFIGSVQEVLVEGFSEETELLLEGRLSQQAPDIDGVVLINEGTAKKGDFVKVEITDCMEYDLIGRII